MENNNNNNNNINVNNNNNTMNSSLSTRPGRKYGLTGGGGQQQQQPQQQQQQHNQQLDYRLVNPSTMTVSQLIEAGRKLSIREDQRNSWMYSLSDEEMEGQFNGICLSLRTESLTLPQRLEHSTAERDLVENNLSKEVHVLHSLFLMLKQEVGRNQSKQFESGCCFHDIFSRLANQVDAVHNLALRSLPRAAESLGAVEYESRLSAAIQILILYVDQVKRKWEREHHELEETKRILKESGVNVAQCLTALTQSGASGGVRGGSVGDSVSGGSSSASSSPASKRRASFPATPLRRISLRNPPVPYASNAKGAALLLIEPARAAASAAMAQRAADQQSSTVSSNELASSNSSSSSSLKVESRHHHGGGITSSCHLSPTVQPIAEEREDIESSSSSPPPSINVDQEKEKEKEQDEEKTGIDSPSVVQYDDVFKSAEDHEAVRLPCDPPPAVECVESGSSTNSTAAIIATAAAADGDGIKRKTSGGATVGRRKSSGGSAAHSVSVTIRRRGVRLGGIGANGGQSNLKSHSWSSGSGCGLDLLPNQLANDQLGGYGSLASGELSLLQVTGRNGSTTNTNSISGKGKQHQQHQKSGGNWNRRKIGLLSNNWLLLRLRQWIGDQMDEWGYDDALDYCIRHWTILRQKKLLLLRFFISFCLALAAIFSLIFTFIGGPSSSSPSSPPQQHEAAAHFDAAVAGGGR